MKHYNILFITRQFLISLGGFTLLTEFSLMTKNYELSLIYAMAGTALIVWVMYVFVMRGFSEKKETLIRSVNVNLPAF